MSNRLAVRATTDAAAYHATIAPLVAADPVQSSVVATNVRREVNQPGTFPDACWMWLADPAGAPVAAAMHTPPWPPHLASGDPQVGTTLAEYLAATGRRLTGVSGRRPAAEAFARTWAEGHECPISVHREEGIYEASHVAPPDGVTGFLRRARGDDVALLNGWARGFISDTKATAPTSDDPLAERVVGDMWVWQDDERLVSMAYASPPEGGVSRISWVYSPPEHRCRGYASAVVAAATAAQLAVGARCMLYTDLANPTSNSIYQAIGYRRVGDGVTLSFDPPTNH